MIDMFEGIMVGLRAVFRAVVMLFMFNFTYSLIFAVSILGYIAVNHYHECRTERENVKVYEHGKKN